jgi:hypothetical protein
VAALILQKFEFRISPSLTKTCTTTSLCHLPDVNPLCPESPCIEEHFGVCWASEALKLADFLCCKVAAPIQPNSVNILNFEFHLVSINLVQLYSGNADSHLIPTLLPPDSHLTPTLLPPYSHLTPTLLPPYSHLNPT